MADINIADLRAKAEAATPGPWSVAGCTIAHTLERNSCCYQVRTLGGTKIDRKIDKEFIAAANPAVVLALLDRLAAAEAARVPGRVDISLLRQAAERCRDAAPGVPKLETLRHLQACFGWETVLNLIGHLDDVERKLDALDDGELQ